MKNRMYSQRRGNISAFRGCGFRCSYCAFRGTLKRSSCPKCRSFEPHEHIDAFSRNPPRTDDSNQFITIGLTGDVSFASDAWFLKAVEYCERWHDRTFMIQSKDPQALTRWKWPSNVVLGTTIETNRTNIWCEEP